MLDDVLGLLLLFPVDLILWLLRSRLCRFLLPLDRLCWLVVVILNISFLTDSSGVDLFFSRTLHGFLLLAALLGGTLSLLVGFLLAFWAGYAFANDLVSKSLNSLDYSYDILISPNLAKNISSKENFAWQN